MDDAQGGTDAARRTFAGDAARRPPLMDSLTQAVLGGAVGTAVAGRTLGRRAALWGALAGTLPDLDILAYPFLDTAGELLVHRGVTHGLAFGLVVGPLLGWLAVRLSQWRAARTGRGAPDVPWRTWAALWTAALVTHPLLDVFTVYGTQLLAPFSRWPFAVGSVFIIDPFYTVPLALFLLAAVVRRAPRLAVVGLAVSTAYLGWGVTAQGVVERRAEALGAARVLATPMPMQSLLWRVVADEGDAVATYEHSLLGPDWLFDRAGGSPRADLGDLEPTRGVETLRWFSRGWLVSTGPDADGRTRDAKDAPAVGVADARFGCAPDGQYVFRWHVRPDGGLVQQPFVAGGTGGALATLLRRSLYTAPVPPPLPCPGTGGARRPPRAAPNRGGAPTFEEPAPQTTQPPAP